MSSGRLEAAYEDALPGRASLGAWIFRVASALLIVVAALQASATFGFISLRFVDWRPTLYAFLLWGLALGASQVLRYGEAGKQTLFVLPALLFTAAMVIFPTIFGLYIAFTDWNLNAESGTTSTGSTIFAPFGAIPISGTRSATWSSMC